MKGKDDRRDDLGDDEIVVLVKKIKKNDDKNEYESKDVEM